MPVLTYLMEGAEHTSIKNEVGRTNFIFSAEGSLHLIAATTNYPKWWQFEIEIIPGFLFSFNES